MKPTVVDLFSGLGGFSQAMVDRGWKVIRVDNDSKFKPDICADVRDLTANDFPTNPTLVVASPPCECFSIASVSHNWPNDVPSRKTLEHIGLVMFTKFLIDSIKPDFWVMENPRGMLRNVIGKPTITTYFASWGDTAYKPTDLWGKLPPMEWPLPKNWEKAPRGSKTGSQGKSDAAERAKIPYKLSEALARAVERTMLDYFSKEELEV